MKSLKVILFNLILFILSISIVNAEEVAIKSIDLISKSEHAIEKSSPTYEGLELNLDVKFERLNDYIEYKIIIENPTNKDFDLELENLSNSEYITYTYNYNEDKVIKANSEEEVLLKIEYLNYVLDELAEEALYTQEDKMYLNFINNVVEIPVPETPNTPEEPEEPENPNEPVIPEETPKEEVENPETGTSIIFVVTIMVILLIIFFILIKINKPKYMMFLIPLLLVVPLSIKANEKLQLKITSNIEVSVKPTTLVKGEQFNISLKSLVDENKNYYSVTDEVIKHFKRSEEAPSELVTTKVISEEDAQYEVVAWFDGTDTIYWYSEATRVYLNEDCNHMFYYMYKAEEFELNNFDASKMKKAEYMFSYYGNNSSGTSLDLTNWNIENLESAYYMFNSVGRNSESISIDVSNWRLENVTNAEYMFEFIGNDAAKEVIINAKNLKFEKAEDLNSIFKYTCSYAPKCTIDLENFSAKSVNNMSNMLSYVAQNSSEVNINLNNLNAPNVEKLSYFFNSSFRNVKKLKLDIENWNIQNAKDLSYMFYMSADNATSDVDLDFTSWKLEKLESTKDMFAYAFNRTRGNNAGIIKINLSNLNLKNIKDMSGMFQELATYSKELHLDISNWKINTAENIYNLGDHLGTNAEYINFNMSNFELANIQRGEPGFSIFGWYAKKVDINLNNWKITDCGDLSTIFYQAFQEVDEVNLSANNWELNNIDDIGHLFYAVGRGSEKVKFIADNWKVNNVKNMERTFINVGMVAEDFEYSIDNWQLKNVENMNQFFYTFGMNSTKPIVLDLSGWDTSSVIDTGYMFSGMNSLKTIYVSEKWNTENINESTRMFDNCENLIGGNGTIFNSSKIDKEYARIDTPETPGYFTLKTTE